MTIQFGNVSRCETRVPRFLFSVHKYPRYRYPTKWFCTVGRLYVGFVGTLIITPICEVTLWIHNMQK